MVSHIASRRLETLRYLGGVGLVGAVLVVYANSLRVPFLLDDFATIHGNPSIHALSPLKTVLFPPPHVYSAGRPVLNVSFALNYAIGGTAVGGYHLGNIAIHAAAALVLFGLVRRTLMLPRFQGTDAARFATGAGLSVAALWALHPMNSASVTYVSQRAESLMGLFYLLVLYCFVRSVAGGGVAWKVAAVGACILGMATKEVMATAPLVVLLYDGVCVEGSLRHAWLRRWRFHGALAATWLVLAALMLSSELGKRAVGADHGLSWINYARIECQAVAHYLRLSLWPTPLVFDYGANLPLPHGPKLILPAAVLVAIAGLSLRQLYRARMAGFLGCAFFLLLAPTSSIIPVAGQPIAENRMYLPLALVVAAVVGGCFSAGLRRGVALCLPALAALALLCHQRNREFASAVSIWRDTVAKQPVNERAWVFLSEALRVEGRTAESVAALLSAVRHRPDSAELQNNLAVALFTAGRAGEAIAHFQRAIQLKPEYSDAYYNFGAVLYQTGQTADALECFRRQLQLSPGSVEGNNFAGLCLARLGNFAAAADSFRRVLELDPAHHNARESLDFVLRQQK